MKEINKKLFGGEWVFSEDNRMAYKLDKQGSLLFDNVENVSEEEKIEFTIEALVHLGVDELQAEALVGHKGSLQ